METATTEPRGLSLLTSLLANPTSIKILIAMSKTEQVYKFQLVRLTGAHQTTVVRALAILLQFKLIKPVQPIQKIKNVGEVYALTPHGKEISHLLNEINGTLAKIGKSPAIAILWGIPLGLNAIPLVCGL